MDFFELIELIQKLCYSHGLKMQEAILKSPPSPLREFLPKSITCWREGYSLRYFLDDLQAGITVGIISIPLALAFALGSGVLPERGLYTAIIAGFLISFLGGSRVQIGGPTGAFIAIVAPIVDLYGYEGLAIATLMAGAMLILMGLARFGFFLRFIPYSVTTGFTTGIALVIFSSQIKDFFGLAMPAVPYDFTEKWSYYIQYAHTWNYWAFTIGLVSLFVIFTLRKIYPKVPSPIVAVVLASAFVYFFEIPVETLETKFGALPSSLPKISLPESTFDQIQMMFRPAVAIALLGAIESLLSAVVADGMTGHKHRSNCELIAQGIANIGSILFGGIPATGAIARTGANIRLGAKTPMAGMIHAITVLVLMLFCASLAAKMPLCVLAAVLIYVAWNMSEVQHFLAILKGPMTDVCVLLITFLITVLFDLANAVVVGVILSAILFLKNMADATTVKLCKTILEEEAIAEQNTQDSDLIFRKDVPEKVTVFEINGPFFFGISDSLNEQLRQMPVLPKVFILRMSKVPLVDTAGMHALKEFQMKCHDLDIVFLVTGVKPEIRKTFKDLNVEEAIGSKHIFPHLTDALAYSRRLLASE